MLRTGFFFAIVSRDSYRLPVLRDSAPESDLGIHLGTDVGLCVDDHFGCLFDSGFGSGFKSILEIERYASASVAFFV